MDFNERGFLGKAITDFVESVEKRHSELLNLCYQANELAQTTKYEFKVNNANGQQVLAMTVFLRVLNGFQSTVLLGRMGLRTDAQVVGRGTLEALFVLKQLCEEKSFVPEYIKSDKANKLKLFQVAAVSNNPNLAEIRKIATPEAIAKLKEEVARENCKPIRAEDVARRAQLHHMYETEYRLLSLETHASPRSMEKLVEIGTDGEVVGFRLQPTDEDIEMILTIAAQTLLVALQCTTKLFSIDRNREIASLDRVWKRLVSGAATG